MIHTATPSETATAEAQPISAGDQSGAVQLAHSDCRVLFDCLNPEAQEILLLAPAGHPMIARPIPELSRARVTSVSSLHEDSLRADTFDLCLALLPWTEADLMAALTKIHGCLKAGGTLRLLTFQPDSVTGPRLCTSSAAAARERLQLLLWRAGFERVWVNPIASGCLVSARRAGRRERPLVSIILPVFNEARTFPLLMEALLPKRLAGADKEILIIESGSTDGTREMARQYARHPEVRLIMQDRPRGKGNAVRAALAEARGEIVLIQDGDLEYDLNDYDSLLEPLLSFRTAVVLGARHGGGFKMRQFARQRSVAWFMNAGHWLFTASLNLLYGGHLHDPFTMFKVFRRDCLYRLHLECDRFDFDHELVIKFLRKGYQPTEIPVNYRSRSFSEGKKISVWRDPLTWIYAQIRYRFVSPYVDED